MLDAPSSCGVPTDVTNTGHSPTTALAINQVVLYTCDTGYTHTSGNLYRTCQSDGTLSGSPPICQRK